MIFSQFIANRVAQNKESNFSRWIIRIATAAVALSVAVMIITTALITGFQHQISQKVFGFWGHIQITDTKINNSLEATPIEADAPYLEQLKNIKKISYSKNTNILGIDIQKDTPTETKGGVHHIQAYAIKPGIIRTKDALEGIALKGIGKDFDWDFLHQYLVDGKPLSVNDSTASKGILISKYTANRLDLKTGDKFNVYFVQNSDQIQRRFEILGIYNTGLEEFDKQIALVDIRQIQQLLDWKPNQVAGFEVFLDNLDDLDPLSTHIYENVLPTKIFSQTVRDKMPQIFEWLQLQNLNEVVILSLMFIVALLDMITALIILVLERTSMIGILKSLGAKDWDIRKVFLYYAARILSVGLFWGNFVSIGLCFIQLKTGIVHLSESDYYLSTAPIEFDWWKILLINASTLGIILLFLIIPSYLVTRISPVKAIKFN